MSGIQTIQMRCYLQELKSFRKCTLKQSKDHKRVLRIHVEGHKYLADVLDSSFEIAMSQATAWLKRYTDEVRIIQH